VPTVFRASKMAALTVARTAAPMVARTAGRRIEALTGAPILVRMWARGRDRISVRTSERDPVQIVERMLEPDGARTWAPMLVPTPQNPARDSVRAAPPHLMRVRQRARALVRLGRPVVARGPSTPEGAAVPMVELSARTAVPTVEPTAERSVTAAPIVALAETAVLTVALTAAPTAERSETAARTVVLTAEPAETAVLIEVPAETAAQTGGPTPEQTAAQVRMPSALTGVLSTTVMPTLGWEVSQDRRVDLTAHRPWREPAEPPEWLTAAPMAELTEELMAAPRPAMGPTAQPPIQTSIATIFSGGLISFDNIS
jgi:hypothetical protein